MEIQKLLTTKELAKYLGIGESTLLQYRFDGTGPAYIKLGHLVRYRILEAAYQQEQAEKERKRAARQKARLGAR